MCKKKFLIIGLQVLILAGFVAMALGSASSVKTPTSRDILRMDRGACGHPDFVFIGKHDGDAACSQACRNAGFAESCITIESSCFCK